MRLLVRPWLAGCLAILLSACSLFRDQTDPTTVSIRGIPPTLEQLNITATVYSQDQLINDLMVTAGLSLDTQLLWNDPRWDLVMRAGVYEIGRQCDQYLDVLFRFNREQRAGRQDLAATAAATAAIMGLSGASAKAIAITAAAFGLATSLFDASVNSVLFTIEPSALRNVALQGRKKYLDDLRDRNVAINSRPDMLIVLQGYLTQCSPAAIEANINNAASGAPSVVTPSLDDSTARNAAVLAAPGTALLREERAKEVTSGPILTKPLPPPTSLLAPNLQPGEEGLSRSEIMAVQRALGIAPANGDPGAPGSSTRDAILEFQRGMNLRDPHRWPATERTGLIKNNSPSRRTLLSLSSMPMEFFSSPFERAYLGDPTSSPNLSRPYPGTLNEILRLLGPWDTPLPTGDSPAAIAEKIRRMHEKIAALRVEKAIAPDKGQKLDFALYNFLKQQRPATGPDN
jgi:hypothetical protein